MKTYHFIIAYLVVASVAHTAGIQEANTNSWHANTKILDQTAGFDDPVMAEAANSLAKDVKRYYELLRDKQWRKTYELRAKAFRSDVPESNYLSEAEMTGKKWGLVNYEVLSRGFQSYVGSTNIDEAVLICKFTELPGNKVSYSTVFWHKEDGIWKCLSPGPRKLDIFRQTRPPIIDWD